MLQILWLPNTVEVVHSRWRRCFGCLDLEEALKKWSSDEVSPSVPKNEKGLLTAMKVPGTKNIVRTAIAFIDVESRLHSCAISLLCSAIPATSLLPIAVSRISS